MKLLFFDIDGTLVSFRTHMIPQSAVDALSQARRMGHKVIIATGRPSPIINNLGQLQSQGLIDGYITMNGAYCFVGDTVLHKAQISHVDACAIGNYARRMRVPCIFVHEHDMCVAGANELSHEIFARQLNAPDIPVVDYRQALDHPLFQITPFFTPQMQTEVEPLTGHCEFARWHPAFVDITAAGNNKAHGIEVIARHFGVDMDDTIAFGDGGNDVPMLQRAAIGVAMGNATAEVKVHADFVAPSVDDDGIAAALRHCLSMPSR